MYTNVVYLGVLHTAYRYNIVSCRKKLQSYRQRI